MHPVARASRWSLVAAASLAVLTAGCEDDRGDPIGPSEGPLDGGILFGTALVSSELFRAFNALAEEALAIVEGTGSLPVSFAACQGNGTATITDNNDADPNTLAVTFTNYAIECGAFTLTLNTAAAVDAKLVLTFLETSPGFVFLMEMPMTGSTPRGVTIQLPSEAGGIILSATTPSGPLRYELEGDRVGLRHEGGMHIGGTLRYEDRTGPLLLVHVLDLEYEFDDDFFPKFSAWPAGSYEIAGFGGGGGFGFGGGTASAPVDVFFDGLGGAAFSSRNRTCVVNLQTGDNPCDD